MAKITPNHTTISIMNLWAKSLRQLAFLAVASFFFSCEDNEVNQLGYPNPNKKFNIYSVEIPLQSSVVLVDSIVTDNASSSANTMVGAYRDEVLGTVRTQPYLDIYPISTDSIKAGGIYDSVQVQFRLNFYAYGFTGTKVHRFAIHELSDTLSYANKNRYYYNSKVSYNPTAIGHAKITLDYDKAQSQFGTTAQDTTYAIAKLDNSFGRKLFNISLSNRDGKLSNRGKFKTEIKGLTLVPEDDNGIIGINTISSSFIFIYYHVPEANGLTTRYVRVFLFHDNRFYDPGFMNISSDRSGTDLAGVQSYRPVEPANDLRFVQNGAPVLTKLDLGNFYTMFADTVDDILINEAKLVITNVQQTPGLIPHSSLMMRVTQEDGHFFKTKVAADSLTLLNYFVYPESYYEVLYDNYEAKQKVVATIDYNSSEAQYTGFVTRFAQSLFVNKNRDDVTEKKLRYISLFPYSPIVQKYVNRTVFDKNNVKLIIKYTRPTQPKQ